MQKIFNVKIERIAHDGAGETTVEGTVLRVHGMLPGESGIVEAHKKQGIFIGTLKELTNASPSRKTPDELHYLSCSPWQVMEYPLQSELKHQMVHELFSYYPDAPRVGFVPAEQFYGYRTKVEFSFCDRVGDETIPLSLAFHVRGGGMRRVALDEGCILASDAMNATALTICGVLREKGYIARDLKTLIIRESKSDGTLLALLFAKRKDIEKFDVSDIPGLSGMIVFHSDERSPASVPTKELWRVGDDHLSETIDGVTIRYSWDSFFQNNVPMFTHALRMMKDAIASDARVLELYSGAGTIGLGLARKVARVTGIEIVEGAVRSAELNATVNDLKNYHAQCLPAEAIGTEVFTGTNVLVLDPPRAGLHPKLIETIREALPEQIIYLSCNPETQARDYSLLSSVYAISQINAFDFYPNTPHVESLLLLNLREK